MGCKERHVIKLINFPAQEYLSGQNGFEEEYGYNPSFSLTALGTWLDFHGFDLELIDLYSDRMKWNELVKKLTEDFILFLGCSVHTENVNFTLHVIKQIKKLVKDMIIVVGGPHATLCPEDILAVEEVDFVSVNEGESALLELALALSKDCEEKLIPYIPGLIYRRDGQVIYNKPQEPIGDLDLLPVFKRELFDINRYRSMLNIISGRGCPGGCIYCAAGALSGRKYRPRNIESVYLEILLMKNIAGNRLREFYFVDDTFTADKKRVWGFIHLIQNHHLKIAWRCQSRIDTIDFDLIDALADTGCKELLYGIESGNQEVNRKIGKNISLDRAWEVLRYTHQKKIHLQCSFMLGHYCDTKETMEDTYQFLKKVYEEFRADMAIYLNTPYPGTYQYIHRERLGLRIVESDYSKYTNLNAVVETDHFTVYDLEEMIQKCYQFFGRHKNLENEKKKLLSEL